MTRGMKVLAACLAGFLVSGCLVNTVRKLPLSKVALAHGSAVIVYGVGVETTQSAPRWSGDQVTEFELSFAKYDPETGEMGNCYRFDRADAVFSTKPGPVRYFAFDVPAGAYAARSPGVLGQRFFRVAVGQKIYVGDFVLVDRTEPLPPYAQQPIGWHDLVAFEAREGQAMAEAAVEAPLKPAEFEPITVGPYGFVCTP